jgi:hypothetical protein
VIKRTTKNPKNTISKDKSVTALRFNFRVKHGVGLPIFYYQLILLNSLELHIGTVWHKVNVLHLY